MTARCRIAEACYWTEPRRRRDDGRPWKVSDIPDVMVVQAVARYQAEGEQGAFGAFPYETMSAATGAPEKVCFMAMERADKRGLLDYGVSLRTAWLTDKGKALLWGW